MIERILQAAATSDFDFRTYANPADPLRHRFDEWVEYYRLKSALAQIIQPRRILEIGVRYGYSALAFLHGYAAAHYTGIDLDVDAFGGSADGLAYARSRLPADSILLREDSQKMTVLPGGQYDLIHVDGQQDEAGIYHDLEMAIRQARYILVDGFFWTQTNFFASSDFVLKHRDLLEYVLVIPGYAGELLLSIRPRNSAELAAAGVASSALLRPLYNQNYYRHECGGWEFQQGMAANLLEDARLRAVFNMAMAWSPRRLLDIGCGRGEIGRQAARSGVLCTGADYSPAAIEIARRASDENSRIHANTKWICCDIMEIPEDCVYDSIVISDVLEHLAPFEMHRLFRKLKKLLSPDGKVAIHTFPNRWYYDYDYKRRRSRAAALGAFLPAQPRSRFEREMHINECNPRVLRRALKEYFSHVAFWFGTPEDPVASLRKRLTPWELAAQRDLFAVAANSPFPMQPLLDIYHTTAFSADDARRIFITSDAAALSAKESEAFLLEVEVDNQSGQTLSSDLPWPLFLSYHWLRKADRSMVVYEGHRSRLTGGQPPRTVRRHLITVAAPPTSGEYILQLTMIQEHVMWLVDHNPGAMFEVVVQVGSPVS